MFELQKGTPRLKVKTPLQGVGTGVSVNNTMLTPTLFRSFFFKFLQRQFSTSAQLAGMI